MPHWVQLGWSTSSYTFNIYDNSFSFNFIQYLLYYKLQVGLSITYRYTWIPACWKCIMSFTCSFNKLFNSIHLLFLYILVKNLTMEKWSIYMFLLLLTSSSELSLVIMIATWSPHATGKCQVFSYSSSLQRITPSCIKSFLPFSLFFWFL